MRVSALGFSERVLQWTLAPSQPARWIGGVSRYVKFLITILLLILFCSLISIDVSFKLTLPAIEYNWEQQMFIIEGMIGNV